MTSGGGRPHVEAWRTMRPRWKNLFRNFAFGFFLVYLLAFYAMHSLLLTAQQQRSTAGREGAVHNPTPAGAVYTPLPPALTPAVTPPAQMADDGDANSLVEKTELAANPPERCPTAASPRFQVLTPDVMVFSAFFDNRRASSTGSGTHRGGSYVRVMAVLQREVKKRGPVLTCAFEGPGPPGERASVAELYEMCENHNRPYGGYYLSCPVPATHTTPCKVTIGIRGVNSSVVLDVHVGRVGAQGPSRKFGTCVPPLHGHIPARRLVQFVELSRILGSQHFTLYLESKRDHAQQQDPELSRVLEHYRNLGLITVIPWQIPVPQMSIWYHGQSVSIGDCLYRNMYDFEYLTFNDLDEFIVPTEGDTWSQLVTEMWEDGVAGYRVPAVFFASPRHPAAAEPQQQLQPQGPRRGPMGQVRGRTRNEGAEEGLDTLTLLERTSHFTDVRTKTIVKPQRIFELGIHHISRPMDGFESRPARPSLVKLHHYRKCIGDFGMQCKGTRRDESMLRYGETLTRNFEAVMRSINSAIENPAAGNSSNYKRKLALPRPP